MTPEQKPHSKALSNWLLTGRPVVAWSVVLVSAIAAMFLAREFALTDFNDVLGNYLQTYGSMYGIIVAFAIFLAWNQHSAAEAALEREALVLANLFLVVREIPGIEKSALDLRTYADAAIGELDRLESRIEVSRRSEPLDRLWHALCGMPLNSERDSVMFKRALDLTAELNDARSSRFLRLAERLPASLGWLLNFGGLILLVCIVSFHVASWTVHAGLTLGLTWLIFISLRLIADLDDPKLGNFTLNNRALTRTRNFIDKELARRPIADAQSVSPALRDASG